MLLLIAVLVTAAGVSVYAFNMALVAAFSSAFPLVGRRGRASGDISNYSTHKNADAGRL
jgi:hypothetical protein